ncbi:uncharacterized protein LAESUDRAFT_55521 [Laetiporus sulphureus 93-53]|uniref:Uncharacterized protein n=1 Tax=Laetiporus sulphureus 93-53 TaxID=1314785 RepID=A0A165FD25_9APHY|nr:uncharacterized protein LAESUDRAFT_55521 [Laetiporus sulphureus 93-53]KZT08786.1 hypothetical protein LAESUDRAFT_55521 [Laetiporus sulphureus 93-53]
MRQWLRCVSSIRRYVQRRVSIATVDERANFCRYRAGGLVQIDAPPFMGASESRRRFTYKHLFDPAHHSSARSCTSTWQPPGSGSDIHFATYPNPVSFGFRFGLRSWQPETKNHLPTNSREQMPRQGTGQSLGGLPMLSAAGDSLCLYLRCWASGQAFRGEERSRQDGRAFLYNNSFAAGSTWFSCLHSLLILWPL